MELEAGKSMILDRIKTIGISYLIFLSISFILIILIKAIDAFIIVDYYKLPSLLNNDTLLRIKEYTNENKLRIVLLVAGLAPLLEECVFRLWLSLKTQHISISLSLILNYFIFGYGDFFRFETRSLLIIASIVMTSVLLYYIMQR